MLVQERQGLDPRDEALDGVVWLLHRHRVADLVNDDAHRGLERRLRLAHEQSLVVVEGRVEAIDRAFGTLLPVVGRNVRVFGRRVDVAAEGEACDHRQIGRWNLRQRDGKRRPLARRPAGVPVEERADAEASAEVVRARSGARRRWRGMVGRA